MFPLHEKRRRAYERVANRLGHDSDVTDGYAEFGAGMQHLSKIDFEGREPLCVRICSSRYLDNITAPASLDLSPLGEYENGNYGELVRGQRESREL